MICQVPLGCESFHATLFRAHERLLPRVNAHVGLQVSTLCKGLRAPIKGAFEGFLPCLTRIKGFSITYMGPHVYVESVPSGVLFVAHVALKWLVPCVYQLMSLEMPLCDKLLPAPCLSANKRPIASQLSSS
jgi:hypothetical protein